MGVKFAIVSSTRKELKSIQCDRCGKKTKKKDITPGRWNSFGEPFSCYHSVCYSGPEFAELQWEWGYHSKKDLERHKIVLCEPCYDAVFKDVKIQIEEYSIRP